MFLHLFLLKKIREEKSKDEMKFNFIHFPRKLLPSYEEKAGGRSPAISRIYRRVYMGSRLAEEAPEWWQESTERHQNCISSS